MDDGLGDLRPDAGDDAVRAHQAGGGHGLQQVLGDQGVDGRHAGDVDDGDGRTGVDDALQQRFHHHLGAGAVERADDRQGENPFSQADDGGRQFHHVFLLAGDNRLARLQEHVHRIEAQPVEDRGRFPGGRGQGRRVAGIGLAERREQGLLEGKDEGRGFGRRKTLLAAGGRDFVEIAQDGVPFRGAQVGRIAVANGRREQVQEGVALVA